MKNLSVIIASLDDTSPDRRGIGSPVRFPSNFNQSQQNDTSLPRAPLPGELARQRLRGWTKDAFRLSGITQVLLCTTSPSSSLRLMTPLLTGEALAVRYVFHRTLINLSRTTPLCQGLPLWGSWRASARLRGWTKDAFRVSGITQVLLCTTSPSSSLTLDATSPSRGGFGIPSRFPAKPNRFHRKRDLFAKGSPVRGAVERM